MTRWLTISQVAREMGLTRYQAAKDLLKIAWAYPATQRCGSTVWDARALDLLRAMRGQPHRTLEPVHSDWLTVYLKEHEDASHAP